MTTKLKFGPADHDRLVTSAELQSADFQSGYQYELIRGRLYVSPLPNFQSGWVERWIFRVMDRYTDRRPDVANFAYNKTKINVSAEQEETQPEPDLAVYHNFPLDQPAEEVNWEDVSPFLVVEVLSESNPEKDLVRNVELYLKVPSIREYWILDARTNAEQPSLRVYRRRGKRWLKPIDIAGGGSYTTPILPEFTLTLKTR